MKKSVVIILLLGILLIFPLVQAQEQSQTYSGINRFIDNVKMFFSSGDNKVMLALEIREKELNSAMKNIQNGEYDDASRNIENARKKLQFVQRKVSSDIADDVIGNIETTLEMIGNSEGFELYALEERKTQLVAELVVEIEGSEGQTLKREVSREQNTGEKKVGVIIEGDSGEVDDTQTTVMEIAEGIIEIDSQIADIIVESNVVETGMDIDEGDDIDDTTPFSPVPTSGEICCKKTMGGETRYHWDFEEDCLNPATIKGEVMDNDVCVALGTAILDQEDPESWGSVEGYIGVDED